MNEAIYRSPKWLRNVVDFEINTGKDIKGEPSKKSIQKEWDKRWQETDIDIFRKFYSEVIDSNKWRLYYGSDELEDIRKKYRGDMSLWDKFDKWLPEHKKREAEYQKKRRERERAEEQEREKERQRQREEQRRKEQRQKDIERELDDLFNLMVSDFSKNPYSDKISTPTVNGKTAFHYTFEDGNKVRIEDNKIYWNSAIYTVGPITKIKFVNLANEMTQKSRARSGGRSYGSSQSSGSSQRAQQRKSHTGHPKEPLYNTLKATVKQREDQLRKMSKTDPDRISLENELNTAKRKLQDMKDKYQFENIKSFVDYFKV